MNADELAALRVAVAGTSDELLEAQELACAEEFQHHLDRARWHEAKATDASQRQLVVRIERERRKNFRAHDVP